jgi:hypothetical protein
MLTQQTANVANCLLLLLLLLAQVGRHISHYIAAKEGSHPYRVRLAELGSGTMLQVRVLLYVALYVFQKVSRRVLSGGLGSGWQSWAVAPCCR